MLLMSAFAEVFPQQYYYVIYRTYWSCPGMQKLGYFLI